MCFLGDCLLERGEERGEEEDEEKEKEESKESLLVLGGRLLSFLGDLALLGERGFLEREREGEGAGRRRKRKNKKKKIEGREGGEEEGRRGGRGRFTCSKRGTSAFMDMAFWCFWWKF